MPYSDLKKAIRQRDASAIVSIMFEQVEQEVKVGYKTENEIWDYKKNIPGTGAGHKIAWARVAKYVLSFYNIGGGVLIFGVDDNSFEVTKTKQTYDTKQFNDQIRKYLGDRIWVDYHRVFIQENQEYVGVAIVPPRGPVVEKFMIDSPADNKGEKIFLKGWSAIRENDSSMVLNQEQLEIYIKQLKIPTLGKVYEVDEDYFRILSPDYNKFIMRSELCESLMCGLTDRRSSVTSLIGIGGVGKTALAVWGALEAYQKQLFNFIVSITAKDRELTSSGIVGVKPSLNTYESLLDNILEVLGFNSEKSKLTLQKEESVKMLLEESNGLIFVDNLETVDDHRVISFLDNLPYGVKALTTSRRSRVRYSVYPVDVGPMNAKEVHQYLRSLSSSPGLSYLHDVSTTDSQTVANNCDGIPLAIRWTAAKCAGIQELIMCSESLNRTGGKGEELLEFSYRRVFDEMNKEEKSILFVLSIFNDALPEEVLMVGCQLSIIEMQDSIERLVQDALIQRFFDPDRNDYVFSLMPITRSFIYTELTSQKNMEQEIRKRLGDYFEAREIQNEDERAAIRLLRQGKDSSENILIDLGMTAKRNGEFDDAEAMFLQALQRNSKSWRALRELAELYRHNIEKKASALSYYAQAAQYSPSRGEERFKIYREYGLLLKDAGNSDSTDKAIEAFECALSERAYDSIALCGIAKMYERKGYYAKIIDRLEPHWASASNRDKQYILPFLFRAYEKNNDILKLAEIKNELRKFDIDPENLH